MSKTSKKSWLVPVIGIFVVAAIVIACVFGMRGSTTVSGDQSTVSKGRTLICSIDDFTYPYFRYDNSNKKDLSITVLFSGDILRAVSLKYSLYYDDTNVIEGSKAHNHAEMNTRFAADGLGADAYSATYSAQSDKLLTSLYVEASDFDGTASKYFLAQGLNKKSTLDDFEKNYQKQNFKCTKDE